MTVLAQLGCKIVSLYLGKFYSIFSPAPVISPENLLSFCYLFIPVRGWVLMTGNLSSVVKAKLKSPIP
jgi:hypothetical protein